MTTELEEVLLGWIESRRSYGLRVSRKLTMKKAEIIYGDLTKDMENVDEDFKASRGWLEKFMKRNGLYPPTLLVLDSDHEGDSDIEIE